MWCCLWIFWGRRVRVIFRFWRRRSRRRFGLDVDVKLLWCNLLVLKCDVLFWVFFCWRNRDCFVCYCCVSCVRCWRRWRSIRRLAINLSWFRCGALVNFWIVLRVFWCCVDFICLVYCFCNVKVVCDCFYWMKVMLFFRSSDARFWRDDSVVRWTFSGCWVCIVVKVVGLSWWLWIYIVSFWMRRFVCYCLWFYLWLNFRRVSTRTTLFVRVSVWFVAVWVLFFVICVCCLGMWCFINVVYCFFLWCKLFFYLVGFILCLSLSRRVFWYFLNFWCICRFCRIFLIWFYFCCVLLVVSFCLLWWICFLLVINWWCVLGIFCVVWLIETVVNFVLFRWNRIIVRRRLKILLLFVFLIDLLCSMLLVF